MDLAGDLLDQHPGRDRGSRAGLPCEAGNRTASGPDGRSRADPRGVRGRAERVRLPAVGAVGMDQPADGTVDRGRRRLARRVRPSGAPDRLAAHRPAHLQRPRRSPRRT